MSEVFTIPEAAADAKVSPSTIKREIRCGRLIATRIRGCVRISREDLEDYKRKCRSVATAEDGKFAFSTVAGDLAALLQLGRMPNSLKRNSGKESMTPGRVVPLPTPLRKPSSAG